MLLRSVGEGGQGVPKCQGAVAHSWGQLDASVIANLIMPFRISGRFGQAVCGAAAVSAACLWPQRCCSLEAVYWLRANSVLPCFPQMHLPWLSPGVAFMPKAILQHGMQRVHQVSFTH